MAPNFIFSSSHAGGNYVFDVFIGVQEIIGIQKAMTHLQFCPKLSDVLLQNCEGQNHNPNL